MKYRLKDQELQRKLDELSDGDFSRKLQTYRFDYGLSNFVQFGESAPFDATKFRVFISNEDVEAVPEYDPHAWNDFPKVMPPEKGTYRVEVFEDSDDSEPKIKAAGYWDGKRWLINNEGGARTRFRPWEEPDE